ncbi:GNAT family N-acetyltransferase [Dyadobacter sandarakinus]|uniref:GNAT family N-acetyltransferase n=1 Tax=Dyadobacter sandarakinus TaxID=2747268 RepID=A0ABX7I1T6_9BACT|nr:GNAT family N-acetyltransferase [Dyadobacter sandarakinus]QRQ99842.1 GNAT family N-acetyltransferase [Dyadobacter sandarakinus]
MNHPLDNPAWHALGSGNRHMGYQDAQCAYFDPSVSPFAALADPTAECLSHLYTTLPFKNLIILVSDQKLAVPDHWKNAMQIPGHQMIYRGKEAATGTSRAVALTDVHIPQMLALTGLTNPGPFLPGTIRFGYYEGIFERDQLVAMAGQRMNPTGFAEISAVCTHPDFLGRGLARELVLRQVQRIQAAGETPFLHVRADNFRAISLYEAMGFETRTQIYFHGMHK